MRILLSTYSCYPCKTSEPGNAWRIINEMLQEHEIWAIIEEGHRHREQVESYLAKKPMPGFHPVFFKLPPALAWMWKRGTFTAAIYYHLWQQQVRALVVDLHRKIQFDLVHHVTYGRYWSPSGLRAINVPFVWGPVGAAESSPKAFVSELPLRWRIFEVVRNGARNFFERGDALRDTARAATIAIGVTRETCAALRRLGVRRVEQLPQMAMTDEDLAMFGTLPAPPPGPLRAICIGRHVHWKGFHLAIRAFAEFAKKNSGAELWVVSDGPFRRELEKTAAQTGVSARVKFLGVLPAYGDVLQKLGQSHVLMHPALHEGFGNVCLEAMAAGRPVVCLDIGGPASQITPETGFAAPATTPREAVAAMAKFLEKIDRDRALLAAMSAAARAHVQQNFTMRRINETMRRFYREAVEMARESARVS